MWNKPNQNVPPHCMSCANKFFRFSNISNEHIIFNKQTYIAYVSNKYNKIYINWNLIRSICFYISYNIYIVRNNCSLLKTEIIYQYSTMNELFFVGHENGKFRVFPLEFKIFPPWFNTQRKHFYGGRDKSFQVWGFNVQPFKKCRNLIKKIYQISIRSFITDLYCVSIIWIAIFIQ